jgi:plastocyanin
MKRLLLAAALTAYASFGMAADGELTITIRDHRFDPAELRVPKGKKIRLTIDNQDPTPEEFESHELNREKVIPGKSKGYVYIGPLEAGRYPYFGDFHSKTAKGVIVAE